ncbi:hypothetical protein [Actinokineospora sp. HUAS TT18]|uniref:hypothetical protein n=1 Tax=Actinokineospora sp. HUAS TT18 TaxID=3447451 RepID=UPI003F51BDD8
MRALIRSLALPLAAAIGVALAPAASADPIIPLTWSITGTTTIAKPGLSVPIPPGAKFVGQIDLADWKLTGETTIPDLVSKGKLLNAVPYTAIVRQVATKPLDGGIVDGKVQVNRYFRLQIIKLSVDFLPNLNLVPAGCTTSADSVSTLTNTTPIDLFKPMGLTGEFAIPSFTKCGLLTPVITSMMSGPGNKMDLTFTPGAATIAAIPAGQNAP